jgi:hypothetical protein
MHYHMGHIPKNGIIFDLRGGILKSRLGLGSFEAIIAANLAGIEMDFSTNLKYPPVWELWPKPVNQPISLVLELARPPFEPNP